MLAVLFNDGALVCDSLFYLMMVHWFETRCFIWPCCFALVSFLLLKLEEDWHARRLTCILWLCRPVSRNLEFCHKKPLRVLACFSCFVQEARNLCITCDNVAKMDTRIKNRQWRCGFFYLSFHYLKNFIHATRKCGRTRLFKTHQYITPQNVASNPFPGKGWFPSRDLFPLEKRSSMTALQ